MNNYMDMYSNMSPAEESMKKTQISPMTERESMLRTVQAYEFALVEVGLFLDTNPHDQTALEYFRYYRDLRSRAESEFTRRFGPISREHMDNDLSSWKWIENPWPWETGSEV